MITAIREGGITWLLPQVGHLAHAEEGPLITWVGAISIWIFGPFIGDITAGRLPNLLWFGITASSVWYGTYLLGRRSDSAAAGLPFGGEPPRDYAACSPTPPCCCCWPPSASCSARTKPPSSRHHGLPGAGVLFTGAQHRPPADRRDHAGHRAGGQLPHARLDRRHSDHGWRAADLLSAQPIVAPQALAALDRPVDRGADPGVVDPRHAGQRILDPQLEDLEPVLLRRPRPDGPRCATCPGICGPPGRSPCWLSGAGARGSTRRISGCR